MRRRILTPLVLAFVTAVAAQSPVGPKTQVGVTVIKFDWSKLTYRPGWDEPRNPASNQELENPRNDPSRDADTGQLPVGTVPFTRASDRAWERKRPRAPTENQSSAEGHASPTQKLAEYTYQVRIKNVSGKTIEAVDWEYLFLDPDAGSEFAQHRFQSIRRAEPGKSLTLTGISFAPPTRILNARHNDNTKPLEESVVIRCVVYSDGTADWRAAGSEGDCDSLRKSALVRPK